MIYFTAGPSQLYPKVSGFMMDALERDIPSLSHRSSAFSELFANLRKNLTTILRVPEACQTFYTGSATEWMERIVQNMSEKRTLHFVGGAFSKRFHDIASALGRHAVKIVQRADSSFSIDDVPKDFVPELVCMTHNETSNGTHVSAEFFAHVRQRFQGALIATDVVSSAPLFPDAFASSDCIFFSVQKGFGLPAGLGVALVHPRAIERAAVIARSGNYTGSYHSFEKLADLASHNRTPETPNVLNMYLLNAVVADMLTKGITVLQKETDEKASMLYDALSRSSELTVVVPPGAFRSRTVIAARAPHGSKPVIERLKKEGMLIHSGYGADKETHVRIANFPAHTRADVARLTTLLG